MFTGLITEVGRVLSFTRGKGRRAATRLTVASRTLSRRLRRGNSIAVSGVCLTVTVGRGASFSADLAAETLARTSLARLKSGACVNLELPLRFGQPLGGHIVQGHVDGVGKLLTLERVRGGKDYWLRLDIPTPLTRYVAEKGSITIEGISLTVARMVRNRVTTAIIPHTFKATNLSSLKPGDPLNIEVDVMAKYAEKRMQATKGSRITLARLMREGF